MKESPLPWSALNPNSASVLSNNALTDGEAKPRTLGLGSEKGGKQMGQVICGNTRPIVGKINGEKSA
jgi:hypothetical protein